MRHLSSKSITWFKAKDNIQGTAHYGNVLDNTDQWAIEFDQKHFSKYLFAKGNFKHWLISTKSAVTNSEVPYGEANRDFLQSSLSSTSGVAMM